MSDNKLRARLKDYTNDRLLDMKVEGLEVEVLALVDSELESRGIEVKQSNKIVQKEKKSRSKASLLLWIFIIAMLVKAIVNYLR